MTLVWRTATAPAAFALVFALARLGDAAQVPVAFCAAKGLLGIPCPGCGITTSVAALLERRYADALAANAAGPFVLLFVIVQSLLAAAAAARSLPGLTIARLSWLNDRVLLTCLVLSWLSRLI